MQVFSVGLPVQVADLDPWGWDDEDFPVFSRGKFLMSDPSHWVYANTGRGDRGRGRKGREKK